HSHHFETPSAKNHQFPSALLLHNRRRRPEELLPQMALTPFKSHFFLFCFLTLIFLVQSRPSLLPSDFDALLLVHRGFGLRRGPERNPCDSAGIFCERRIVNSSYVLRVTRLVFESLDLDGRLSPAIGQLSELKELSLPNNQLVDQIPAQIVDCQKLEVLNLGNNRFSGKIPPGLSSLIRLRVLDLSANRFTGTIKFLKYFPNLEKLNLADNMFAGKVPMSLKSFRNLRFINLSGNGLLEMGPSPLMRNDLDQYLSSELAEERIPKRYVFAEASQDKNQSLSAVAPASSQGSNGSTAATPSPSPSPMAVVPSHKHKKNEKRKIVGWVLGFLAGGLAGIVSGMVFSMLSKLLLVVIRGRGKDSSLKIFSPLIKKPEDLSFLEKEDGLGSLDIIGRGGCGEVYKAVLPGSNGKEIAIKKIIQPPRDADELTEEDSKMMNKKMRQIKSEIQTVGQIRHRNLLALLAHLPRPDCHYLVYEYMKNGSLQDYLQHVKEDEFFQHTDELSLVKWMRNVMTSEDPKRAIDPKLLGNGYEEQMLLVLKVACFCTLDNPKERPNSKDARSLSQGRSLLKQSGLCSNGHKTSSGLNTLDLLGKRASPSKPWKVNGLEAAGPIGAADEEEELSSEKGSIGGSGKWVGIGN
ncbi:Leucine-rich repeat receptor-like serine/threonine/tyrosine-protein kinase SOBIR1, partial [Sesamum alatum]